MTKSNEVHSGCGESVVLAHEVWRGKKCGAVRVPVTAPVDLLTGEVVDEGAEGCPDCARIAEEDGDILPPACAAHGGSPGLPR